MKGYHVALGVALLLGTFPALAGEPALSLKKGDTFWRAEISVTPGTFSGKTGRNGDFYFTGSVEYDWVMRERLILGLRAYPLFWYHEHDEGNGESENIEGGGIALTLRYYIKKNRFTGWYGEASSGPVVLSDYFEDNSSRVNFLNTLGIGYQFKNDWHITATWQHISNAGLGADNAGVNGFGMAIGYRF